MSQQTHGINLMKCIIKTCLGLFGLGAGMLPNKCPSGSQGDSDSTINTECIFSASYQVQIHPWMHEISQLDTDETGRHSISLSITGTHNGVCSCGNFFLRAQVEQSIFHKSAGGAPDRTDSTQQQCIHIYMPFDAVKVRLKACYLKALELNCSECRVGCKSYLRVIFHCVFSNWKMEIIPWVFGTTGRSTFSFWSKKETKNHLLLKLINWHCHKRMYSETLITQVCLVLSAQIHICYHWEKAFYK